MFWAAYMLVTLPFRFLYWTVKIPWEIYEHFGAHRHHVRRRSHRRTSRVRGHASRVQMRGDGTAILSLLMVVVPPAGIVMLWVRRDMSPFRKMLLTVIAVVFLVIWIVMISSVSSQTSAAPLYN